MSISEREWGEYGYWTHMIEGPLEKENVKPSVYSVAEN
jgi:hypothetical protein